MENQIQNALNAWKELLGSHSVLDHLAATKIYSVNTVGSIKKILGSIYPKDIQEVSKSVRIAHQYNIPLYPISTGRNWGYGSATPVCDNCIILNLSKMNKIISMDEQLGLVTLEPGVSQHQLDEYLSTHQLPFMTPVTGSSQHCSMIGNALERGYGINPIYDHCSAIMAIEAVLPDGSVYRSPLADLGMEVNAYKWGIGPYLDGLFTQSNLGIITSMTLALVKKPEHIEGFFFSLQNDQQLFDLIEPLRETLQSIGSNTSTIKITNQHRLLATMNLYPDKAQRDLIDLSLLEEQFKNKNIYTWMGFGAIYGHKPVVNSIKKVIRSHLKNKTDNLIFFNSRLEKIAHAMLKYFPFIKKFKFVPYIPKLNDMHFSFLKFVSGAPHSASVPMAYYGTNLPKSSPMDLNPDKDGCGLIWFAPLLPMKGSSVIKCIHAIQLVLSKHNMRFAMTLTNLSNYCFDIVVPLLFDVNNISEVTNAHDCYKNLFHTCKQLGFIPYRIPNGFIELLDENNTDTWRKLGKSIKNTIDPEGIFAPGKYL